MARRREWGHDGLSNGGTDRWTQKGPLPGAETGVYHRVPMLLMPARSPLLGLAFVIFLPFIGFATGRTFDNRRAYAVNSYEMCKKCHFDTYARTLESVHYEYLKAGVESAPICTDCHGAHNIVNPHEKRAMVSRSCATCHAAICRHAGAVLNGASGLSGTYEASRYRDTSLGTLLRYFS